jgi:hypothetical protein
MTWLWVQRGVAQSVGEIRRWWTDLRERLAAIDWLVIPPAQSDVYGSGTPGEVVTGWFTAWMRTVSVWSIIATAVLAVCWVAHELIIGG